VAENGRAGVLPGVSSRPAALPSSHRCSDLSDGKETELFDAAAADLCTSSYVDPAHYPRAYASGSTYSADCSSGCQRCEYGTVAWLNHSAWGCYASGPIYSPCPTPSLPPSPPSPPPPLPPLPRSPPYNLPPSYPPSPPLDVDTTAVGSIGLCLFSLAFLWASYELLVRAIIWPCCLDGHLPRLHPDSTRLRLAYIGSLAVCCGAELPRYALLATIETYVNGGEAMLAVHERLWIRGRHTWSYLTLVLSALSFSLALTLLLISWSDELSHARSRAALLMRRRSLAISFSTLAATAAAMSIAWAASDAEAETAFVEPYGATLSWLATSLNTALASLALLCASRAQLPADAVRSTASARSKAQGRGRLKATLITCLCCFALRIVTLGARQAVETTFREYEQRAILFSIPWFAAASFVPTLLPVVALLYSLRARPPRSQSTVYIGHYRGGLARAYRTHHGANVRAVPNEAQASPRSPHAGHHSGHDEAPGGGDLGPETLQCAEKATSETSGGGEGEDSGDCRKSCGEFTQGVRDSGCKQGGSGNSDERLSRQSRMVQLSGRGRHDVPISYLDADDAATDTESARQRITPATGKPQEGGCDSSLSYEWIPLEVAGSSLSAAPASMRDEDWQAALGADRDWSQWTKARLQLHASPKGESIELQEDPGRHQEGGSLEEDTALGELESSYEPWALQV